TTQPLTLESRQPFSGDQDVDIDGDAHVAVLAERESTCKCKRCLYVVERTSDAVESKVHLRLTHEEVIHPPDYILEVLLHRTKHTALARSVSGRTRRSMARTLTPSVKRRDDLAPSDAASSRYATDGSQSRIDPKASRRLPLNVA